MENTFETKQDEREWAREKITQSVADGQPKDTSIRELVELTGARTKAVEYALGLLQSVNEIEVYGSYRGPNSEDRFEIRRVPSSNR